MVDDFVDVVLFELASRLDADRLAARLRVLCPTWVEPRGPYGWVVGIDVGEDADVLARALGVAAAHSEDTPTRVVIELDGRSYHFPRFGEPAPPVRV
jgi:hypothetical protein